MQAIHGRPAYSATDLVGYLECEHLLTLERAALAGAVERIVRPDEVLDLLRERGEEHETRFLAYLQEERGLEWEAGRGPSDDALSRDERLDRDQAETIRLMRAGIPVIYQATLYDGTWLGYADFLLRVDGPGSDSDLGAWHYEVADTKLARKTKPGALLQMCVYSDLVAGIQGRLPERMHVALGGSGHRVDSHRLADYLAYYRRIRDRFLVVVGAGTAPVYPLEVTPEPVGHCDVCRWKELCDARRRKDDHLSLVAFLRRDQARRLRAIGVPTRGALGALEAPLPEIDRFSASALDAARAQASLQVASEGLDRPLHELIAPIEEARGLAALPEPSWGDLFFDMEGDPFAEEDGLEYLFGVVDPSEMDAAGEPAFRTWWAHSRADEKRAFEAFVDFVTERWKQDPAMHVYHYAAYERGRLGMLSTRHGTREAEVDRLLRGDVLVDLFRVVRQGLRVGTESYSIKKLEPLYALHRKAPLKEAGLSVVAYEKYVRSVLAGTPDQSLLDGIGLYNEDDCLSNLALRSFLEGLRAEAERTTGVRIPRASARPDEREREPSERDLRIRAVAERLTDGPEPDPDLAWSDTHATRLLANLLEWHRREEKSEWWEFFRLCQLTDAELTREDSALGELRYEEIIDSPKRSHVHRYRFDPAQEHRIRVGDRPVDPRTQREAGRVTAIDPLVGSIDLIRGKDSAVPHPSALIPGKPITADAQKAALERIGTWVADHGIHTEGPYRAVRDLLRRVRPRTRNEEASDLALPSEPMLSAARRLAADLRHSALPVQGPPGSGKTFTGAEMVLALIADGRQVGITAFTHKAIANLLDEVMKHAAASGQRVRVIRKVDDEDGERAGYRCTDDNAKVAAAVIDRDVDVAAGTPWMWARPEFEGLVDTIFVDEAGQMSLANVVSIGGAAHNLVLLGDPQQLAQVTKGAHPEGAACSGLEHVLAGAPTLRADQGLFLAETWRMHPTVTAFTSELFYEGRLASRAETTGQRIVGEGPLEGAGLRWLPVRHRGNRNSSIEECAAVARIAERLMASNWVDRDGVSRPMTWTDILFVAPYNAHVQLIAESLPDARVGTVDRFQGQEAAVVVYSLATSSEDELPRSMEFLYSLNRLNVATSRAKCLSIIVASPDLLEVACRTTQQMRLANALCRFVELADPVTLI